MKWRMRWGGSFKKAFFSSPEEEFRHFRIISQAPQALRFKTVRQAARQIFHRLKFRVRKKEKKIPLHAFMINYLSFESLSFTISPRSSASNLDISEREKFPKKFLLRSKKKHGIVAKRKKN